MHALQCGRNPTNCLWDISLVLTLKVLRNSSNSKCHESYRKPDTAATATALALSPSDASQDKLSWVP